MLSIRMQRTGRKGHAMFRLVVQDSRLTPTSGKVVAQLGSFDPHNKTTQVNVEKAKLYLSNGAQPSGRAALLLQKEGVELPKWVKLASVKGGKTRHPEKLRKNQPAAEVVKEPKVAEPEAPAVETVAVVETAAADTDAPEADKTAAKA